MATTKKCPAPLCTNGKVPGAAVQGECGKDHKHNGHNYFPPATRNKRSATMSVSMNADTQQWCSGSPGTRCETCNGTGQVPA